MLVLIMGLGLFTSCQKESLEKLEPEIMASLVQNDTNGEAMSRSTCGVAAYRISEDGCCYIFDVHHTNGGFWSVETGDGEIIEGQGDSTFEHCYSGQSFTVTFRCGKVQYSFTNGGCLETPCNCEIEIVQGNDPGTGDCTLKALTSGDCKEPLTYDWQLLGNTVANASFIAINKNGLYTLTATDANGCEVTNSIEVKGCEPELCCELPKGRIVISPCFNSATLKLIGYNDCNINTIWGWEGTDIPNFDRGDDFFAIYREFECGRTYTYDIRIILEDCGTTHKFTGSYTHQCIKCPIETPKPPKDF